jgi:hypothetical protein
MTHHTHCEFQIGDSLIHLHYLRQLARRHPGHVFVHGVKECHIPQMREFVEDLPQIRLIPFQQRAPESILIWKNADGWWEHHPLRDHYARFHLAWFRDYLAPRLGLPSPFETVEDLLHDAPRLLEPNVWSAPFDVLFINSAPCSGQFRAYLNGPGGPGDFNPEYCDPLIAELAARYNVICTAPTRARHVRCTLERDLTLCDIGNLSLYCPIIVMIATGPGWPTLNVWNIRTVKHRVILLDREVIGMAPNSVEASSIDAAREVLRLRGVL